ncbi:hypothetical protein [Cellulosilyticum sp. I15G10I2]|uniref:hypothetical protein n=1 Tax=Cellulosilyticum sp. I15G10I2 TaxID=1892843 RepID=UPI00085CA9B2|nr:hypothetical protein [Cellulosilyticum sp. I15G10I2]
MFNSNRCGLNTCGANVVIFSALIGILIANNLDDQCKKITGSAFLLIGFTIFTMSYGCKILDTCKPAGIDNCYVPNPYYPEGFYQ